MTKLNLYRSRLGIQYADADENPALVDVRSGPYRFRLPLAHHSVGQIRSRLSARFDLTPQAEAFVEGIAVKDDAVVKPRESVLFANRAGIKG